MPSDADYAAMAYGRGDRSPEVVRLYEESIAFEQDLALGRYRYDAQAGGWVLAESKRTKNGHVLYTPKNCYCKLQPEEDQARRCPVCDGGLAVCMVCGKAEAELDQPCRRDA